MFADRNLINRRNVREDPHTAYRADRDFMVLLVTSRIIAAAFHVLALDSRQGKPKNLLIPEDLSNQSKFHKLQFLHKAAGIIVDELVVDERMMNGSIETMVSAQERQELLQQLELNTDRRFPCRFPGCKASFKYNSKSRRRHELRHDPPVDISDDLPSTAEKSIPSPSKETDDMFNYNSALLCEGLFFMNFLDAVSEGDGERIIRQYKYLMLLCKADGTHSTKYALESLYQLLLVHGLSEKEAEKLMWNRGVNNHGGPGKNIPHDLEVEHSNNYNKQRISNLGVNVNEKSVTRISRAEQPAREITSKVERSLHQFVRSGKHVQHFPTGDLDELLKNLVQNNVFKYQEGRKFKHFKEFPRDVLENLDMSKVYTWINEHKKKLSSGDKAR